MTEPRLKSAIRVSAHIRRAESGGAFATIVRRGNEDAGAIAVKLYRGRGDAQLFVQSRDLDGNPIWRDQFADDEDCSDIEVRIDDWLKKEAKVDPDLWIVEIDDPKGRTFLED